MNMFLLLSLDLVAAYEVSAYIGANSIYNKFPAAWVVILIKQWEFYNLVIKQTNLATATHLVL